jgi:type IV pilus assembly protein PilC
LNSSVTVDGRTLAVFTRQLATLLSAGMPLTRGLGVLARQESSSKFGSVLSALADAIRSGGTFTDGLRRHPGIFSPLYAQMVRAGETSGTLPIVLGRLAVFLEKNERIKGKVKAAMLYPVIILVVAVSVVAALVVFVVPKFQEIFAGLLKGQPLPMLTRAVLGLSYFVRDHAVVAIGLAVAFGIAATAARRTRRGTILFDRLILHAPVVGDLVLKSCVTRFARTFGSLLSGGVPMLQALAIARETAGNSRVAAAIGQVHDRVKEGESVARPLAASAIFPPMVASLVEVGEETGALAEMLTRIADVYDDEVDNAIAGLTSLIEPAMIVFMALLVGTIVLALFLPIVRIIQSLS